MSRDDAETGPTSTIERERKFLIDAIPAGIGASARCGLKRCTLAVEAGGGAERTDSNGRSTVNSSTPHGLDGLVFAEVEFGSFEALDAFEPPTWFGREVADDGRYTNAALAMNGRPDPR